MFKINQPTRTSKGEYVIPFLVEGRLVHVIDKDKNQKIIDLSDFNFESKKKPINSDLLIVKGTTSTAYENPLFNPQEGGYLGGATYEEKTIITNPPTFIPTIIEVPVINTTPIEIKAEAGVIYTINKSIFTYFNESLLIEIVGKAITLFTINSIIETPIYTKSIFEYLLEKKTLKITGNFKYIVFKKQIYSFISITKLIKISGKALTIKVFKLSTNIANDFYGGL